MLAPIFVRGAGAFVFRGTIEHRRFLLERFDRGRPRRRSKAEQAEVRGRARSPSTTCWTPSRRELERRARRRTPRATARRSRNWRKRCASCSAPARGTAPALLMRNQYGADPLGPRAATSCERVLYAEEWDYSRPHAAWAASGRVPRADGLRGHGARTALRVRRASTSEDMLRPRLDILLALPDRPLLRRPLLRRHLARDPRHPLPDARRHALRRAHGRHRRHLPGRVRRSESRLVSLLRTCISTLAGVPSIVFGLFGLAFFINTMHVSDSKSVLAGR